MTLFVKCMESNKFSVYVVKDGPMTFFLNKFNRLRIPQNNSTGIAYESKLFYLFPLCRH